nr:MAG TPA: hypothetical protein [Caudoviricetes sp.]
MFQCNFHCFIDFYNMERKAIFSKGKETGANRTFIYAVL